MEGIERNSTLASLHRGGGGLSPADREQRRHLFGRNEILVRAANDPSVFTITKKAPILALSNLRHYAKQVLTHGKRNWDADANIRRDSWVG